MNEYQIVIASGIDIHSSSTATEGETSQRAGLPRAEAAEAGDESVMGAV